MTLIAYLIAAIAILSGVNHFIDHSKYWDEGIMFLQACIAVFSLYHYNKKIVKPIRWLDKKCRSIEEGVEIPKSQVTLKEAEQVDHLLDQMTHNQMNAIDFIKNIEEGKLDFDYNLNDSSNKNVLAESLVNLRNKLKDIAINEKERNWTTEGLAKFVEILRANDEDIHSLANKILSNLVNYINANQGQIYILNDDEESNQYLEMVAFYAYDRKKFFENKVEIGQGLVGQTFLEKETVILTELPENYVKVTSGLGEATPKCILIVPLKVNNIVYGILEVASFQKFKPHEINFLEKIGESIASTISNARVNQKTKHLLEDLQQQQEEMKAQEEEMRQNMEELQATQEEMARKEKEIVGLLELSSSKEEELKKRLSEIEEMTKELELENGMFTGLMDVLVDRITIKDKEGTYLRMNKTKTDALKKQGIEDALGKSDKDIFGEEHFQMAIKLEKEIMDSGIGVISKEEKITRPDGSYAWVANTRVPFKNKNGETLGTIVVTRDISKEKEYKEKLDQALEEIEKLKKK